MVPPENNSKIREAKVKVKMDPGNLKNKKHKKDLEFAPRCKFSGACRALKVQIFYRHRPDNFKATIENITIYVGATYVHDMGITRKDRKETGIPHTDNPEDNVAKSTK